MAVRVDFLKRTTKNPVKEFKFKSEWGSRNASNSIHIDNLLSVQSQKSLGKHKNKDIKLKNSLDMEKAHFLKLKIEELKQRNIPEEVLKLEKELENLKESVCLRNQRLILHILVGFNYRNVPVEDLFQEGYIGLMKAFDNYIHGKGCSFASYAFYWIYQAIQRYFDSMCNLIQKPFGLTIDFRRLNRFIAEYNAFYGENPSREEIKKQAKVTDYLIDNCQSLFSNEASLEEIMESLEGFDRQESPNAEALKMLRLLSSSLSEEFNLEKEVHLKVRNKIIFSKMDKYLNEREKDVLQRRFGLLAGEPETLEEVSKTYNLTKERIRQIEVKALKKLRRVMEKEEWVR